MSFRREDDVYVSARLVRARDKARADGDPMPSRADIIHRIINESRLLRHKYRTPLGNLSLIVQMTEMSCPGYDPELLAGLKQVCVDFLAIADASDGRKG